MDWIPLFAADYQARVFDCAKDKSLQAPDGLANQLFKDYRFNPDFSTSITADKALYQLMEDPALWSVARCFTHLFNLNEPLARLYEQKGLTALSDHADGRENGTTPHNIFGMDWESTSSTSPSPTKPSSVAQAVAAATPGRPTTGGKGPRSTTGGKGPASAKK
jgi:hypothetical protein